MTDTSGAYSEEFEKAFSFMLPHEGTAFTEDPDDPGGATKFGISLSAHPDLGLDGIKNLTKDEAKAIYHRDYWLAGGFGALPYPISAKTFDLAVNTGIKEGTLILQRSLNAEGYALSLDGILGRETAQAATLEQAQYPEVFKRSLIFEAQKHYLALAKSSPKLEKFRVGWLIRAASWPK